MTLIRWEETCPTLEQLSQAAPNFLKENYTLAMHICHRLHK